jgi:hypothetical protein
MKKVSLLIAACLAVSFFANAQCQTTMKWTSAKSEFLDSAGNIREAHDEMVEVISSPTKIRIVRGSGEHTMEGDVANFSCNWKNKENGKTTFNSLLMEGDKTRHATIKIEAVNGKTTILLQAKEEDSVIRLNIDSSEEVK